jgi:hypothetical protein
MLQQLTSLYSAAFLLTGMIGFAVHGASAHPPTDLFGLFPVNGLHNLVRLLIGVAGIFAVVTGPRACRIYARVVGIAYFAVGVLGFFDPTGLGLMPIGGPDIALHLLAGALAMYLGFSDRFAPHAASTSDDQRFIPSELIREGRQRPRRY